MIQIRHNTFETNSSSTHSIVICTDAEFKGFKKNKLFYYDTCRDVKKFCTWEELVKLMRDKESRVPEEDVEEAIKLYTEGGMEAVEDFLADWEIYTDNTYYKEDMEEFTERYTTPNGEKIMAFGYYGSEY